MDRLREQRSETGELLRRIAPLDDGVWHKQRVRAQLRNRSHRHIGLRPAFAVAASCLLIACAATMVRHVRSPRVIALRMDDVADKVAMHEDRLPKIVRVPALSRPIFAAQSSSVVRWTEISPSTDKANQAVESTENSVAIATPDGDAHLVMEAMTALRRDHDAPLAMTRINAYLAHDSRGPLAEEAFALAIEAELARKDQKAAATFASDYLARFPNGHFASVATSALTR